MSSNAEIDPDSWFFVVICPVCGQAEAFLPAPSPREIPGDYPWPFRAFCICGAHTLHPPSEIKRASGNGIFRSRRRTLRDEASYAKANWGKARVLRFMTQNTV